MTDDGVLREQVRERYAAAALAVSGPQNAACCGSGAADVATALESGTAFGAGLYASEQIAGLPEDAVLASLGCGNPLAVAALAPGERVLDLGSGGGIDVLLSARRVGPAGKAYGLDMTEEMLALARANAAQAGATNVEFLKGRIEAVPLPAGSVDVVISNCVINLSTDKPAVLAEMFRVLAPGGRISISDVVAEDHLTPQERAERGSYVGCIAGALSRAEYLSGLAAAGFVDAGVEFTHEAVPGLHGAIVRATKPALAVGGLEQAGPETHSSACCSSTAQASCCEPSAKSACCGAPSLPASAVASDLSYSRVPAAAAASTAAGRVHRHRNAGHPGRPPLVSEPHVLFVCVKNGGKSQMAAALMRHHAGDSVHVDSAGTHPGTRLNALSVQVLQELGLDVSDQAPRAVTSDIIAAADLVITLGREAVVDPVPDTPVVNWDTDEPSLRGIDGVERMRIIRDDIAARVRALLAELTTSYVTPTQEP